MQRIITLLIVVLSLSLSLYAQKREATQLSVKTPNETFVGAVFDPKSINTEKHQALKITIPESITISSSINGEIVDIIPSYENMIETVHQWLKARQSLDSQIGFSYSIKEISNHDELDWFFGQKIAPNSFFSLEGDKDSFKSTVAINLTLQAFTIDMDLPDAGHLYPNDPAIKAQGDEMIYINRITFGKKAVILVHSEEDFLTLKKALQEVLTTKSKELTAQTRKVIANAHFDILILGNPTLEEAETNNPLSSVLNYFNRPISLNDYGTPILFSASYIKDNSVFTNFY